MKTNLADAVANAVSTLMEAFQQRIRRRRASGIRELCKLSSGNW